jgi:hypothetical protein
MATREDLYKQFGPKLIEAVALVLKEEINLLRLKGGLPERTNEQLINSISNRLYSIPSYDWMDELSNT